MIKITKCLLPLILVISAQSVFATSDTTAPQLVSVDFTPKTVDVSNGSQLVTVTAHLTDAGSTCPICGNSGVNYAYFYFYSPSGNQSVAVGFDSSRRVSGTAQDGIYQNTLTIPTVSESGNWTLTFGYVYDLLGNHTYYSIPAWGDSPFPSGTPTTLAVTSAFADTTPPQLVSIDFTPKSVDVTSGSQVVTVTAHLTDDNSGVNYAYFYFYSPSGNQSVAVGFDSSRRVSGTAQDGIYQNTLTIPKVSESGNWTLTFGYVYDPLGNHTYYSIPAWGDSPFPSGTPTTLAVTCGTADKTPPQLVSVDFTPKSVDVTSGAQVVTLTTHLTDDITGLNYATFYFYSPSGNQSVLASVNSSYRVSGTAQDGIYQITLTIPKLSESGNWTMTYVHVYDGAQNHADYSAFPTSGYSPYPSGTPTILAVINGAVTTRFETESLQVASKTPPPAGVSPAKWFGKFTASAASGGAGTYFNANAIGNYITYTVPVANPGIYQVRVGIQTKPNKGKFQLAINGLNVGRPQDEYNPSVTYVARDIGVVAVTTAGNYAFKFTVTGKNASSSGYTLAFDYIELVPTTRLETELVTVQSETPPPAGVSPAKWFGTFNDPAASGGAGTYFNANAKGNYITYTLPVANPGTYQVRVGIQTKPNKGKFQLAINGLNVGPPQDEYNPSVTYVARDVGVVAFTTAGNYAFKFTVTGKNASSSGYTLAFDYIELLPTTHLETELLTVQSKTPPPAGVSSFQWFGTFNDPAAGGGAGTYFNANAIGNYITYTLPVAKPGTYQVRVAIQTRPNKGIFQLAINGLNVGPPQDEYNPSTTYIVRDLGMVSFPAAGNYPFKFTVTGKNASSVDYRLAFDYIELVPQ
jgi:hypothetical protein